MREWTGDNTETFAVMSREEVRDFDRWAIEQMRIPGAVLMENAGRQCADAVVELLGAGGRRKVCIFCGGGNNGGDGFVVGRHLASRGVAVQFAVCVDPAAIRGDAGINYTVCRNMGLPVKRLEMDADKLLKAVQSHVQGCDVLVDAVLGTGMRGELKSPHALLISCLNAQHLPIVSVDIPSGMDCDTGLPLPVCIEAAVTVTFAALKQGFADCPESRTATGRVFVADIGITPQVRP